MGLPAVGITLTSWRNPEIPPCRYCGGVACKRLDYFTFSFDSEIPPCHYCGQGGISGLWAGGA